MVRLIGERARFLFTCCEENNRTSERFFLVNYWVKKYEDACIICTAVHVLFFPAAEINYLKMLYQRAWSSEFVFYKAENNIDYWGFTLTSSLNWGKQNFYLILTP